MKLKITMGEAVNVLRSFEGMSLKDIGIRIDDALRSKQSDLNELLFELREILCEGFSEKYSDQKKKIGDAWLGMTLDRMLPIIALNGGLTPEEWKSSREFWMYMACEILPDIVMLRKDNALLDWPKLIRLDDMAEDDEDTKPPNLSWFVSARRNLLYRLWWSVEVTRQPDPELHEKILTETWSTDLVMHVIERPGRYGYHLDFLRSLSRFMHYNKEETVSNSLYKGALKLHTARIMWHEPIMWQGGIDGYVESLFEDASVKKGGRLK